MWMLLDIVGEHCGGWGWGWGDGWWIFGAAWMVLFWGAVLGLAAWAIARATGRRTQEDSALEIARGRYASGEITREEFDRLRSDLSQQ